MTYQNLSQSKVAFVQGVAAGLAEIEFIKWASDEAFADAVYSQADKLAFDPTERGITPDEHVALIQNLAKLAEESCEKEENAEDEKDEKDEKKEMPAFLKEKAKEGAAKLKHAMNNSAQAGEEEQVRNNLEQSAAHDAMARHELQRRPKGFAESQSDPRPPNNEHSPGHVAPHPQAHLVKEAELTRAFKIASSLQGFNALSKEDSLTLCKKIANMSHDEQVALLLQQ